MFTYRILSHRASKSKFTDIGLFSLSLWTLISDSYFLVPLTPSRYELDRFPVFITISLSFFSSFPLAFSFEGFRGFCKLENLVSTSGYLRNSFSLSLRNEELDLVSSCINTTVSSEKGFPIEA